ncbi:CocE/NonD family hydrolase [Deminuibacter soli]|uniref:CocE/NonD family hydrolase n=1 Tax=Deminuibacter soli TaxID=2291815 RepID=A0A3E1NR21_9BACT|nr:CocE/NonD family hydrolase [Deminuibacter soli]RFM30382.1 CocE/NonD family hydrolase [Deminuibacter soli]
MNKLLLSCMLLLSTLCSCAQGIADDYIKIERMIPMRDGTKLFTAIYMPKDTSVAYPFLLMRTPYSCAPYGEDKYPRRLGPNALFPKEKYIFVNQDVRGRYMSEGKFEEMTPAIDNKKSNTDVDESSDTYDTVDWLLKNIKGNNGKAGIYGISYPGFYASASLPNAHPALKAVSPQAPVTDEFEGDDANHRGAFFLMDNFSFMNFFDHPRTAPWTKYPPVSNKLEIKEVYDFYLNIGPIKNLNTQYFHDSSKIWNEYLAHTTKDAYWQARNIRPHLKNVQPAVLVVGGWFDAEDMFGALKTYEAIEKQSPHNQNRLVMGPWTHGGWERPDWNKFATYHFGSNTSGYLQQLEFDFFNFYLKGKGNFNAAEATMFVTGSNEWKSFSQWPPKETTTITWYLDGNNRLNENKNAVKGADEYVSDPASPVPYIDKKSDDRINEYMAADQRFAAARPDVLHYAGEALKKDFTLCGPVTANLFVSTTGTDADFIVKLIDVLPDGTQQLVRAEVIRGKFRNSFVQPEAFVPGKITPVTLVLNDVAHTFQKGHQVMVQVQSSWFPLVDRNPQTYVNIATADEKDFQKATIKIYHDAAHPSHVQVSELN